MRPWAYSSLAVDALGVGLSSRPVNASDVQYPTSSAALSQVARHLKTASLLPGVPAFNKVIGIGHSAGSGLLNFGAIVEGPQSPFDGLILTASLSTAVDLNISTLPGLASARDVDPLRWGTLDPAYFTATNRSIFYPADLSTFSPRTVLLDEFTEDVGTVGIFAQTTTTSLTTGYTGPVAKVVGSEDQLFCAGTDRCGDVAALTAAGPTLWPAARSFEVVVEQGSGHDLNLDFFADGPFNTPPMHRACYAARFDTDTESTAWSQHSGQHQGPPVYPDDNAPNEKGPALSSLRAPSEPAIHPPLSGTPPNPPQKLFSYKMA
ncbi:hypothetical protein B0H16DRAFT_1881068 [Mycena metata]|uniref:AB hydrolase-1 domain-containing protein n=1 Tax=Mycena metata TaxID=1033252 RepID=A0AAD7JXN5_9AGAR|nr:hypothetical protein B0H16DRAFT_1881068 [Mycena metata]